MPLKQKTKRKTVAPGNWVGPPNSRGIRAGESFFKPSPSRRSNNNRGARSAPTHIGMLPNNVIRKINDAAGFWSYGPALTGHKELSGALTEARVMRSLKGLQLLPPRNRRKGRAFYDPKYETVLTSHDLRLGSPWSETKNNLLIYHMDTRSDYPNPNPNRLSYNEIKALDTLRQLRQRAANAGRRSMRNVQNKNVLFYSVHHPNMKIGPHT